MFRRGAILAGVALALFCIAAVAVARGRDAADRREDMAPVVSPHGTASPDTQYCAYCHTSHVAFGRSLSPVERDRSLCLQCHSGQEGAPNVLADYRHQQLDEGAGGHKVTPDGEGLACTDCHTPHQDPADNPGLLRVRVPNEADRAEWLYNSRDEPVGNAMCYSCHGPRDSTLEAPPPGPLGDFTAFEGSAHNLFGAMDSAQDPDDSDMPPPSERSTEQRREERRDDPTGKIACLFCHGPHGSDSASITKFPEEDLCFRCHTKADPNTASGDSVFRDFTVATNTYGDGESPVRIYHHPVSAADQQDGDRRVECVSCHNPHFDSLTNVGDSAQIANPRRTTTAWPVSATKRGQPVEPVQPGPTPSSEPVTYGRWARALLTDLGAPTCQDNRVAVVAWQVQEGTSATFNPLATTYPMQGAPRINEAGVRAYASMAEGLDATRRTLTGGSSSYGYADIVASLQGCAPAAATAEAIAESAWCAGCREDRYVVALIDEIERAYPTYSDIEVPGGGTSFSTPETVNAFCTACHIAPDVPDPIEGSESVPYDVRLVNDTALDAGGQPHDLFEAQGYATSLHGELACTECHDTHGSSNAYALREVMEAPDGTPEQVMSGFQGMDQPGDRRMYADFCVSCHQESATPHVDKMLDQGSYCRECHFHTSDEF